MNFQLRLSLFFSLVTTLLGAGCWAGKGSAYGGAPSLADVSVPVLTVAPTIAPPNQPQGVTTVAFSPLDALLATGSRDGTVVLWNVSSGQTVPVRQLEQSAHRITCLKFSPDGVWLAAGAADNLIGGSAVTGESIVYVWNVGTGVLAYELSGHTDGITGISWSPDGTRIATSSDDHSIRIWNTSNRELVQIYEAPLEYESVSWSPGDLLAGGNYFSSSVWKAESDKEIFATQLNGVLLVLSFSPDGSMLAGGESWGKDLKGFDKFEGAITKGWLHVWNALTGETLHEWEYDVGVNTVAWSPDSRMIAMKTFDSKVIVWDVQAGIPLYRSTEVPDTHSNIAWSADGSLIAWVSPDGGVSLWKVGQE